MISKRMTRRESCHLDRFLVKLLSVPAMDEVNRNLWTGCTAIAAELTVIMRAALRTIPIS